jgi:hypothetical protein
MDTKRNIHLISLPEDGSYKLSVSVGITVSTVAEKQYLRIIIIIIIIISSSSSSSWDIIFGIATGWMAGVRIPRGSSFLHKIQTGSGVQQDSYPMGTGGFLLG